MAKEIKSSIELAMEKVAKLPRLSEQELRERREREYGPMGRALAERLLAGDVAETQLRVQLFRYDDDRGEILREAFVRALCGAIDLEDREATANVLENVKLLVKEGAWKEIARPLNALLQTFQEQKRQRVAGVEEAEQVRLRALGISGSAVRPNLQVSERWQRELGALQERFRPQLDELTRELSDHLTRSCLEARK